MIPLLIILSFVLSSNAQAQTYAPGQVVVDASGKALGLLSSKGQIQAFVNNTWIAVGFGYGGFSALPKKTNYYYTSLNCTGTPYFVMATFDPLNPVAATIDSPPYFAFVEGGTLNSFGYVTNGILHYPNTAAGVSTIGVNSYWTGATCSPLTSENALAAPVADLPITGLTAPFGINATPVSVSGAPFGQN